MIFSTIDYIMIPVILVAIILIIGKKMGEKGRPQSEEPSKMDLLKRIEVLEKEVATLKSNNTNL